jgi:hypothetical protein
LPTTVLIRLGDLPGDAGLLHRHPLGKVTLLESHQDAQ